MAYDLYGAWDPVTGHNAGLHKGQGDEGKLPESLFTVDFALKYWLDQGCPPEKLVLGLPLYGRTFSLWDTNRNGVRAPSSGAGIAGPFTATSGFIGYNELCSRMLTESWSVRFDDLARVPFAVFGRNWVSYDNSESLVEKLNYGLKYGIAGYMVWSIETDDFHGICHGESFPLLKALNRAADNPSVPSPPPTIPPIPTLAPTLPPNPTAAPTLPPTNPPQTPATTPTLPTTKPPEPAITTPTLPLCTTTKSPTTTTTTTTTPTPPIHRPTTWTPAPTTTTSPIVDNAACKEPGFASNPSDCSSFFICIDLGYGDLHPHKFHCPNGLYWDAQGHYCDYASNVNCL